ncbi:MAG: metal-dependent hydrolase [Epsilonproteobacteria bacterium]|nr:metal-dependent hydrolase [Campylobacterota bacterium]
MPNYRTHLIGGAFTYMAICCLLVFTQKHYSLNFAQLLLGLYLSLLGSIFPDIDIRSRMQRLFLLFVSPIFFTAIIYQQWKLLIILSASILFITLVKHRSLTHNIWFILGLPLCIALPTIAYTRLATHVVFLMYIFFVFGALSHRFLDYGPRKFFTR